MSEEIETNADGFKEIYIRNLFAEWNNYDHKYAYAQATAIMYLAEVIKEALDGEQ